MKNIFDITIAVLVIPLLLIIFPVIYICILFIDGRPSIYKQERVGKNGKVAQNFGIAKKGKGKGKKTKNE